MRLEDVPVCLQDCLVLIYVSAKTVQMFPRKQKKELHGMMALMIVIGMILMSKEVLCIILS